MLYVCGTRCLSVVAVWSSLCFALLVVDVEDAVEFCAEDVECFGVCVVACASDARVEVDEAVADFAGGHRVIRSRMMSQ